MVRIDPVRVRLYSYVKLLLAAIVTLGVATTGVALATASPASATATPTIANVNANYSLIGTGMPKAFTGTTPANQTDATLTSAVTNPSTATTLAFASISTTYNFSPVGDVDVYAACSDTVTGTQSPSYVFEYTGNPFTVSGTSLASGGTGVTGVSLLFTNPSCSSTTTIPSGSEVYQTGSPETSYAIANVTSGTGSVNTASLAITSAPPAADGYAFVDPVSGQIYMTPEPTATGNFSLTYAYCVPGVTLTSDPSGLSDGNCATATVNYIAAQHCELVGENVAVSISSSDIYQSICSSTVAPATVTPGESFTYDTIPGTSVIPVEESTSVGNATIQYADNFVSVIPVPAGVTYVPGSAQAVGGDPNSRGKATVEYCTAPRTGCDATLSGNYKTTYPYIELELNSSVEIPGGSLLTLPYVQAQFTATGAPGTEVGAALTEFRLSTQVDIPIIGSNTAAFDGYPTSCGTPAENTTSSPCSSSTAPPYAAPTLYPFTEIVPGVTAVTTPAGYAGGSDAGGSTVDITGTGFTGASAVDFGSTPATSFTVNSSTSITAVAPPSSSDGPVDVTVTTNGAASATSAADQFTYSPSSAPDAPAGIAVVPGDGTPADGAATVTWAPAFGEGSAVTGYTVTATDDTDPADGGQTCTGTDPTDSCSLSGLTDGDTYTFSVTATNGNGTSTAGTVTVNEGAPSAPTGASATAGNATASVSFGAPVTSGDGSALTGYTVTATDRTNPANGGQTASGTTSPITVSGLTDGDTYTFSVTATNSSGTSQASSASSPVEPIGPPNAPTGLTATSGANAQSVVSFYPPAVDNGATVTSLTVTATDTTTPAHGGETCTYAIPTPVPEVPYSCTVTGLTNGDSYTFTATATNTAGASPASAASTAIVPATVPGAPTGVTAASNTAGGVVVSWTAPTSNGGAAITSYTAKPSSGSSTCTATAPATTCTITGTTIGTSYTYTVTATNAIGTSAASTASASVKTTSLPAAPTAVSGTGQAGQVTVSFTGDTTTATEGGSTITGYTATATDVTTPANGGQTATATASPIVVTGLTNGDEYTFTVHATTAVGNSPESAASAQVVPGSVPTPPLGATATNVSPGGNAQVSWTPPSSPGGTIVQYTVTSSTGSKTCVYTGTFGVGETDTCTVTGLTIGTSYTYTVTATNLSGTSSASAPSNAVVSTTVPSAPTSPSATTGNQSATVSFTGDTTTATEGGTAITGYTVTATDVTNPANGGQTATGSTSPITVTGLTDGDSYTFTVTATNANGPGAASVATAAVNPGRPSAPSAVVAAADASSQTTLDISWAAATSPDGTSPITGYTVTNASGGTVGAFTCTTTGATSCNVTGLTAKTAYTFTVTATNQYGTSPASAASASQDAGYPGIPTGVTVSQVSPIGANSSTASISVSWTVPNNGGSALTTETATSSSGSKTCTDTTHLTAGQTASCTMTGLTTGTSTTVSVKATNANGSGTASAASAAIVPQTLPAAPTAASATTGNGQETVTFTGDTTASTEGGSAITGYTVTSTPGSFTCTTTTTSCTVTGLTDGTSYTFTVTATTADGTSVASAATTALHAGAPNPPTGVVSGADATSQTTLDVSWTAATSPDGTSPITGYTVTSSPGGFTCSTGTTSCNVTGLTAKTAYTFTVTATNQYGTSAASAASTSEDAGYPGIPAGAHAALAAVANASTGQVTVSWTVPNNGGSALTSQTATSSSGSKTCTDNTDVTAGQTAHCTVTGLTNGTAYTFTVKDVNANGTGTASASSNSITVETEPLAPTIGAATAGNHSATVAFTAPSTTNSGTISSYTVTATDSTTPANGGETASGASSPVTVTGLTNGDTYTFSVTATGSDGTGPTSAASGSATPSTVPDAPTGVTATAGDLSATVSWTAPSNEGSAITGYTVSDGQGDTCSTSSTSCTVTGLSSQASYTFTVTATNADGTGAASGASNTVQPTAAPDAPTGVTAAAGDRSATVSWTAAGDEGSPVTGYTVTDGSGDTCSTPDGSTTSCTVTGLTNGTAYTFTVTATNADGTGAASVASNSVTPSTVPDAPTGVIAQAASEGAQVSWTAPSDEGSAITGYTVSDGLGDSCTTPDGSTTVCAVSGLTNGDSYTFTVTATNADGTGAASLASNPVTPESVPDAPTGLVATAGDQSASLTWAAPSDEGSAITGYTVSDGVGDTCTSASATCTVTGLTNGTAYSFTVTATNANGTGPSSVASTSVTPSTVPDAPTGVVASAGDRSVSVSWSASDDEGSAVTGYTVSDGVGDTCTGSDPTDSCTVTGLTNGTAYSFTVTATNANGTGPSSVASPGVTPSTVPDAPTGVVATAGNRSAIVSWTAAGDEGSTITGYTVSDGVGDTCSTSGTTCTVTGLTNGTAYSFTVTATSADGTGSASAASTGVTPSTVPDAPTGVVATAGDTTATVTWNPAADEGSPVTGYVVTASNSNPPKTCATTAATTCTIAGLSDGASYTFTVTATNADGTGGTSAPSAAVVPTSNTATITSGDSDTVALGKAVKFGVTSSGTPSATVSATGLPAGVTLKPAKGGKATLEGKPVGGAGIYTFTLTADNGTGPGSSQTFTLTVFGITSPDAATFTAGTHGSFTIATTPVLGGSTVSVTLRPKLSGLTATAGPDGTATLSGTPAAGDKTAVVTVKATDGPLTVTQRLTVTIDS